MKFGLFLGVWEHPDASGDDQRMIAESVDYVCEAERLGFHSAMLTEHHFTGLAQPSTMALLAFLAARTRTIRLGSAVIIVPWHNPLLIAEQVATLDILSSGRFDCGLGRGFRHSECHGFAIPADELQARFDEGLEVLRKCWSAEGRFSHQGRFWTFNDVTIDPKPVQHPHAPVWMSVASEASIGRAAELGYGILLDSFSTAAAIGEKIRHFRACVEATGRLFDPMTVGVTRAFHITQDERGTQAAIARHQAVIANNRRLSVDPGQDTASRAPSPTPSDPREIWLVGERADVRRRLEALRDVGVAYVLLMDSEPDHDGLEALANSVAPYL